MGVALRLYEQLTDAGEDKQRARLIAEAFEALEARYPHIPELVTRTNLSETELKLTKEIEQVRLQIEQVRADLSKEIEQVRLKTEQVRAELSQKIEQVRAELKETELKLTKEIEQVRRETKDVEVRLTQAIHRQTLWVILAIGGITGLIRWLDFLLK